MKKSKMLFILFVIASFMQNYYFICQQGYPVFTFLMGISRDFVDVSCILNLLFLTAPIIFIIFFFSGTLKDLTDGYGKLLIIRRYSKTKLVLKELAKSFVLVIPVVLTECLAASVFAESFGWMKSSQILKGILAHTLCMFLVLLALFLLEMFFDQQYASALISFYVSVSCCLAQFISRDVFVRILFFPCMIFGYNSMADKNLGEYLVSMFVIATMCAVFILMNVQKMKKKDIF